MASCDDGFSLLDEHQNPDSNQPSTTTQTPPFSVNPYDQDSDPFDSEPDPSSRSGKRATERDDINNGVSKRTRLPSTSSSAGDYRKDREEWSDTAIACLLEAYTEKFVQLNRGNLRGRDWEEVAATVSERCDKQSKSVEQCKNKVDNLKKRYKLERHRLSNGGVSASHWPWFQQMEQIVGNTLAAKATADEEKNSVSGGSSISTRQPKRHATATAIPGGQIMTVKSKSSTNLRWRRVVFKISGAALAGTAPNNIDPKVAMLVAREVSIACRYGVEVAVVVGGRNFFCGDTWVTSTGLDRCTAYQIGMMATVMNSILLQSALEKLGVQTRVQSAFSMPEVAEPYSRQRAIRHLEKGRVVIFGGIGAGTGNPLFSTDTAAALRASEIHADAVLKGTNMDGVFVCDPRNNNIAAEHISFRDLASRGTSPMDMMAMTFCEENGIPVVIFNLHEPGNISRALCGEQRGEDPTETDSSQHSGVGLIPLELKSTFEIMGNLNPCL
ncbi:aspartate/glutamate/uridylate kinase family protein [Abeliophyllum distichum]|uniref:UMP kinase n=1 Tax=Abeliophyllum distichum TaxID=126358 RepID=A0ABD1QYR1_9LAMI